jgi:PhnB protein
MKRIFMQVYVKGSEEAVKFYRRAFDAPLVVAYQNDDSAYIHAELDVYGQILAVCEADDNLSIGNQMQFCLHFESDERDKVAKAYEVLLEVARRTYGPLGPCPFSPYMASLVDKFGIFWCIFTAFE